MGVGQEGDQDDLQRTSTVLQRRPGGGWGKMAVVKAAKCCQS